MVEERSAAQRRVVCGGRRKPRDRLALCVAGGEGPGWCVRIRSARGEGGWNRAGVAPVLEGWGLCGPLLSVGRVWSMRNLVVRLRLVRAAFAADREGRAGYRRRECEPGGLPQAGVRAGRPPRFGRRRGRGGVCRPVRRCPGPHPAEDSGGARHLRSAPGCCGMVEPAVLDAGPVVQLRGCSPIRVPRRGRRRPEYFRYSSWGCSLHGPGGAGAAVPALGGDGSGAAVVAGPRPRPGGGRPVVCPVQDGRTKTEIAALLSISRARVAAVLRRPGSTPAALSQGLPGRCRGTPRHGRGRATPPRWPETMGAPKPECGDPRADRSIIGQALIIDNRTRCGARLYSRHPHGMDNRRVTGH